MNLILFRIPVTGIRPMNFSAKITSRSELQKPFGDLKVTLNKTKRDFVYSLGGWDEWEWGDSIGRVYGGLYPILRIIGI
jgi:hypothetical protein